MRAMSADHEELVPLSRHHGVLAGHMTKQRTTFGNLGGSDSLREVGALGLIAPLFRHVALSCSAPSRPARQPIAALTKEGGA